MLRIKFVRRQRGVTQAALAVYAGMSVGDVSRIENGRQHPTASQRHRLAEVLGVDGSALLEPVADDVPEPIRNGAAEAR